MPELRSPSSSRRPSVHRRAVPLLAAGLLLGACAGDGSPSETGVDGPSAGVDLPSEEPQVEPDPEESSAALDASDWDAVLEEADGQTVDWWMYGGDDRLNSYVTGYVTEELAKLGVTLNQVKINDAPEAINTVLGEKQAGRDSGGTVDAIWVNGENFATLKQADGWLCGWPEQIPSAANVDLEDPAIATDFGTPVDGCEGAWNRAQSVLVYEPGTVPEAATSDLDSFEAWVTANPGRFTYPAPPDFTGSMVVRTFFYDVASDAGQVDAIQGEFDQEVFDELAPALWDRLNALEPALYREDQYPEGQPDVTTLFADGQVGAYVTYDSGGVGGEVADGVYPETTRSAVFSGGMIGNVNFVGIPFNAADTAGALVLVDLLQSVDAQYEKLVDGPGYYPAIDPALAGEEARFAAVETPDSQLPFAEQVENSLPELQSEWLTALEEGWVEEVLQQ